MKTLFFGMLAMLAGTGFSGVSEAAMSEVFGSIDPIVIETSGTSLTMVSFTVNPNTDPDTFILLTPGNLSFGLVDMTVNGIYANTPANGDYGDTPHRAGSRYNDIRFYVGNNGDRYTVQATLAGPLLALPHPGSSHPEGTSPVHLTTYRFTSAALYGTLTSAPENIRFEGVSKAVPNNVAMILYDSGASVLQDAFGAYVALDFLALNLLAGSYDGGATWEVVPTP